ncbi:MAG: type II toxin-antitoxin system HicA family toxin [Chitinophagaceae bacterium]|nr:type II toxin-antitoxin system HicA family toxin [Chitinophagaceae bacterium]
MKLPRDINASGLIKALQSLGYEVTRQTGSHIRLTTVQGGTHHITIPNHNPIKIGTLSSILNGIAEHFNTTKEDIIRRIF